MTILSGNKARAVPVPPGAFVKIKALRAFDCPFYENGAMRTERIEEGAIVEIDERLFANFARYGLVQKAPGRKKKEAEKSDDEPNLE